MNKIESDLVETKNNLKKRVKIKKLKKSNNIDKTPNIFNMPKLPKKINKIELTFD